MTAASPGRRAKPPRAQTRLYDPPPPGPPPRPSLGRPRGSALGARRPAPRRPPRRGGARRGRGLYRPDAVLLELVVERAGLDAEQARGLGLDAAALVVGLQDQLALEILEDLGQRHLARGHGERVLAGAAAHARGQRAEIDLGALGEHQRLLDHVLELAHVAGPVVGHEPGQRGVVEPVDGRVGARAELGDEVRDEARDVVLALAQRRHVARHDVQPVEEILAEAPGGDLGFEVLVGRRDDAHVDLDRLLAADALELALLQHAQAA